MPNVRPVIATPRSIGPVEPDVVESASNETSSPPADAMEVVREQPLVLAPDVSRSSAAIPALFDSDFQASIERVIELVQDARRFTPANAVQELTALYRALVDRRPEDFDFDRLRREGGAPKAFEQVQQLTRALIDAARRFGSKYLENPALGEAMKNVDRLLTYVGDFLVLEFDELQSDERGFLGELSKEAFHVWSAPGIESLDDLPDVFFLAVDGANAVSGTIKHIPACDGISSHLAMIVRHEGKLWCVDALSSGVNVHEWTPKAWLKQYARADIYVPDQRIAKALAAAATECFREAKARWDAKNPIPYDFSMGAKVPDYSALYCAKKPSWALRHPIFAETLGADLMSTDLTFPEHGSVLPKSPGIEALLKSWGAEDLVTVTAPSDIRISPKFQPAAQIRALPARGKRNIRNSQIQDAVYGAVFNEWIEKRGYAFFIPEVSLPGVIANAVVAARSAEGAINDVLNWFGIPGLNVFSKEIQKDTAPDILKSVLAVQGVLDDIVDDVEKRNQAFREKHGRDMAMNELLETVEDIRSEDERRYIGWLRNGKRTDESQASVDTWPDFHDRLHPIHDPKYCDYNAAGMPWS
jgi:hypothetical protein